MPHLLISSQGHEAVRLAVQPLPLGPGWSEDLASHFDVLEVWGSSAVEPGEDYTESVARDAGGVEIARCRIPGY